MVGLFGLVWLFDVWSCVGWVACDRLLVSILFVDCVITVCGFLWLVWGGLVGWLVVGGWVLLVWFVLVVFVVCGLFVVLLVVFVFHIVFNYLVWVVWYVFLFVGFMVSFY